MLSSFAALAPLARMRASSGWDVNIDRTTYQKYESLPAMRPRLKEWFTVFSEDEARNARINLDASARCPFFSQDSLCSIHRDFGEKLSLRNLQELPSSLTKN